MGYTQERNVRPEYDATVKQITSTRNISAQAIRVILMTQAIVLMELFRLGIAVHVSGYVAFVKKKTRIFKPKPKKK